MQICFVKSFVIVQEAIHIKEDICYNAHPFAELALKSRTVESSE